MRLLVLRQMLAQLSWGAVGLDMGLYKVGVGAHVDVVEFVDFLIGLSTLDILNDDK